MTVMVHAPECWVEIVRAMRAQGIAHIFECGPGKALAGMVKRIDENAVTGTVLDPQTLAEVRGLLS